MTNQAIILAAAKAAKVAGALLLAICSHESGGLHNIMVPRDGDSPSIGMCQIKKSTAEEMGYKGIAYGKLKPSTVLPVPGLMEPDGKPEGLMIPSVNAKYAARYLKQKLKDNDGDLCKATAAYNMGHFKASKKHPGKPVNFKYVKKVTLYLDEEHKDMLICGPRKVEE